MRHLLSPLPLCASLLLAACGQAADDPAFGSLAQPIVNGNDSSDADNTVVYVHGGDLACSGTVIAPNLVATALHCVTDGYPGTFACDPDGTLTQAAEDQGQGKLGSLFPPDKVTVRLGATSMGSRAAAHATKIFSTGSTQICRGDIAFVVLDQELDVPVTPVRLDYGVRLGDTLRVLGYGETEAHTTGVRRIRDGVRVVDVGPNSENVTAITAAPRTFVVTEGPCQGDSGGPALSEETGALVGVYSLAEGSSCTGVGVRNVYTSLFSYSGLALDAFEFAGAEPILDEAPTAPEKPAVVGDTGCTVAGSSTRAGSLGMSTLTFALLGLAISLRRSRQRG